MLADSADDVAASVNDLAANPAALIGTLSDGAGIALMKDSYRNIVSLPSALTAYRAFFLDLLDENREGAALFHCTTGKDRTGWAAASLLLALGVSEEDVRADYIETNTDLLPLFQPLFTAIDAQGMDSSLLKPVLGVRAEYLDEAIAEARARFGTVEGYFSEGLGLDTEQIAALRARFVTAA